MHPGVESLVSTYRDIVQPRMSSLPMFNEALRVEAVDFQAHQDRIFGVIITPWFMNLVVLPAEDDDWMSLATGESVKVSLPGGDYECTASTVEGLGTHLALPLFTTVKDFTDQDTAVRIARDILQRLRGDHDDPVENTSKTPQPGKSGWPWPLSRRDVLLGKPKPGK
jgi:[NiFe] hydrogenase assembly HybE family chaperone